jgi:hypothetical protein
MKSSSSSVKAKDVTMPVLMWEGTRMAAVKNRRKRKG